ncbi:MAG: histidine phosphatase family protein, partial [Rhizobiales bacterium]|nr:histidine phosphatase family protein [Rhizobacter sp.]
VQAEALAQRVRVMNLRGIVASDLPRALRTAEAIAAATGLPLETTPLLQERNFGDWRGRPYDGMAIDPLTMREAPPNGESAVAFAQRVSDAFAHVLRRQAALGGPLAVVTHGLVIRALLALHVRLGDGMVEPAHLGNTSLSIVDAQEPHLARLLNCTAHLDPAARDDAQALAGG